MKELEKSNKLYRKIIDKCHQGYSIDIAEILAIMPKMSVEHIENMAVDYSKHEELEGFLKVDTIQMIKATNHLSDKELTKMYQQITNPSFLQSK